MCALLNLLVGLKKSYIIKIAWTFNHVQCNMSNVENVQVQSSIVIDLKVTQLAATQVQDTSWKLHYCNFIYCGLFVINDGLHVDLVIPRCCGVTFVGHSKLVVMFCPKLL